MFAAFKMKLGARAASQPATRVLRAGAVLLSIACLTGCPDSSAKRDGDKRDREKRDGTTSSKTSKTANSAAMPDGYPKAAWPKKLDNTVRGPVTEGIVTVARTFATHVTTEDTVAVALRFEGASGPWAKTDAVGQRRLNTTATFAKTEFILRRGDQEERLTVAGSPSSTNATPIAIRTRAVQLSKEGLKLYNKNLPWKAPSKLLGTAGPLTIQLQGKLGLDDKFVPYSSGTLTITIAQRSPVQQSHHDLRTLASVFVQKVEGHKKPPATWGSGYPIETSTKLKIFRFSLRETLTATYEDHYVDIAMGPAGKAVAAHRFMHFGCVAGGTRVATPNGNVNVEDLGLGDRVWSMDLARNKRMATRVVAVRGGDSKQLVVIDGLSVTPAHPLWIGEHGAGGSWIVAGDVARGNIITVLTGERRAVASYEAIARKVPVYDLTVEWPYNFFAEGILVHNKSAPVLLRGKAGDPWSGLFARGPE